eukprot:gi/632990375/ref/XP_007884140.1/ PREDICTED: transmembrane protein C9orf91-like [Callorhinchus milii]
MLHPTQSPRPGLMADRRPPAPDAAAGQAVGGKPGPSGSSLDLSMDSTRPFSVNDPTDHDDDDDRLSQSSDTRSPSVFSVASERPELYNGQLLVVLTARAVWWARGFDLESSEERLAASGVQVPLADYEIPIRRSLMSSKVRRYMYFSSPGFSMILAPTFYLVTWCGLFSTLHLYLSQYVRTFFWGFCLLVSLVSVLLTTALILTLSLHGKKINLNTDGRLMWANENLWRHNVLVGLLVSAKRCSSLLHLCFIYFNVQLCEQKLASLLDDKQWTVPTLQAYLHTTLGHLNLVLESSPTDLHPNGEDGDSEESPLLPGDAQDLQTNHRTQAPLTLNTLKSLVPKGTPQEMAHQLMATYSGLYVRLLVSQQPPPHPPPPLHAAPRPRVPLSVSVHPDLGAAPDPPPPTSCVP